MAKHAGIARFTYNWGLATWNDLYKSRLKPNIYLLKKFFNKHLKAEYAWIKEKGICQKITQYAFEHLGQAFSRFFQGIGEKPQFKKKGKHDSFTLDNGGKPLNVGGRSLKLPTIGWVKTYEALPHTTCKKFTISRTADEWFISFTYEQDKKPTNKEYEVVGVDLGVKTLATLSTGKVFPNQKHYKRNLNKLQKLSRSYSRKVKGSNNLLKAQIKLARYHAKIKNVRHDNLHKITTYIAKNHKLIVMEDLNVKGMLSLDKLSQSIADCGFYEFKRQLTYKADKFGSELLLASRWFPSSKTCSNCGCKKEKLLLSDRVFNCDSCGFSIDRDLNASINISRLAETTKPA
uniref:Transposase, IS605 OrfB family n=2 Tax=Gloeothece TaxID=28070 RepID=E0U5L3_GLOV7|nr:transposase, IS605 OrfB family [Gloeothece verrucosa PCC 7822]